MPSLLQFCSGISTRADFSAVVDSGIAPGVQTGVLRSGLLHLVEAHLRAGGLLFVDSGAYPARRTGRAVDFSSILDCYERLASIPPTPTALHVVAPDVVGDPVATGALLSHHRAALLRLARQGVSILVPVHPGVNTLEEVWASISQEFPRGLLTPALPMRSPQVTVAAAVRFVRKTGISNLHLLGTSRRSTHDAVRAFRPELIVSADANLIRAAVGIGRSITQRYREALNEREVDGWRGGLASEADGTEFSFDALNTPGSLTPAEEAAIVSAVVPWVGEREARRALRDGSFVNVLGEELACELCAYVLPRIYRGRIQRAVGSGLRRDAVAGHFRDKCASESPTLALELQEVA